MDMFKMKIKFLMVFTMALFVILLCGCGDSYDDSYEWYTTTVYISRIKDGRHNNMKDGISIGTCDTIRIRSFIQGYVEEFRDIYYKGEIKTSVSVTPDIGIVSLTHLYSEKESVFQNDYYLLCGQKAGKVAITVNFSSAVTTGSHTIIFGVVD